MNYAKLAPDIYLSILKRLHIQANEALVIEESSNGILAAQRANLKVIGFKGVPLVQDTSAADLKIHSFAELSLASLRNM